MSDDAARTGYALGIDGGGTKTHAVVVDARGRIRGEGYAGSANHEAVGLARAAASLRDAAGAALSAAGCGGPPDAAWVGLAGIDSSRDVRAWQSRLSNLARRVRLMNDAELPLCALPHRAGIALIAGTGSIALGRNSAGATARAGGWGHTLGDEGSGYAIGRQALQAVTRAADGRGPHTALSERILAHWGLAHPEELFARVYPTIEKGDIAQLAPFVLEAAHEGDAVARGIVRHAAGELALAVHAVAARLVFPEGCLALALSGGLLAHQRDYRARVVRAVRRRRALRSVVVVACPALAAARAALEEGKPHAIG